HTRGPLLAVGELGVHVEIAALRDQPVAQGLGGAGYPRAACGDRGPAGGTLGEDWPPGEDGRQEGEDADDTDERAWVHGLLQPRRQPPRAHYTPPPRGLAGAAAFDL